jgi:hypothetical protein
VALGGDRERLAATFDRAAGLYQRVRPEYPNELYDHLIHVTAAARLNLAAFDVAVVEARFEDWTPDGEPYAMVFAATAWHWVDPALRYRRAAAALGPGGHLAVWGAWHVVPYGDDPFFEDLQEVYDEIGESLAPDAKLPRPQELDDDRTDIDDSGLFEQSRAIPRVDTDAA